MVGLFLSSHTHYRVASLIKHAAIEKEAQAIIEAIRHWRHFLTGQHFTLRTDQKSVYYMFDQRNRGKIKNDKIMRWRIELAIVIASTLYTAQERRMYSPTHSPGQPVLLHLRIHCTSFTRHSAILVSLGSTTSFVFTG